MEGPPWPRWLNRRGLAGASVISDGADAEAAQSFNDFVKAYDQRAWNLIATLLRQQASAPLS